MSMDDRLQVMALGITAGQKRVLSNTAQGRYDTRLLNTSIGRQLADAGLIMVEDNVMRLTRLGSRLCALVDEDAEGPIVLVTPGASRLLRLASVGEANGYAAEYTRAASELLAKHLVSLDIGSGRLVLTPRGQLLVDEFAVRRREDRL